MTSIVIVNKTGSLKEQKVKNVKREDLYKKCGFRKTEGFELRHAWPVKVSPIHVVEVYSRKTGKAGQENKYEFAPPIDNDLYFGSVAIIGVDEQANIIDLTVEQWKKIHEKLYGGFEDLGAEDSEESEDEMDQYSDDQKTKNGYLKDGFVVDQDDSEDEEEDEDEEEEEEEDEGMSSDSGDESDDMLSGGSELEEEDYYYSDDDK